MPTTTVYGIPNCDTDKATVVDAASARAVLLANPSAIKRPVVRWADGALTVGFDAAVFARHG